jgi:putative SOS response-associated peptidase YedK
MCSYIGIKVSKAQYIKLKNIEKQIGVLAALKTLQSGFEYKDWAIIRATNAEKKDIEIVPAHWEFIPNWIENETTLKQKRKEGIPWLNATAENLLSSKMFRDASLNRRCLVPISHFFEWRHHKHVGGKKPVTYPYCISVKNEEIFFVAGIYEPWLNKETGLIKNCFAIITTKANEKMAQIHNTKKRMPCILTEDLAHKWIMENLAENEINEIASTQIPSEDIESYTISKDFRTAVNPLIEFEYEGLSVVE